MAKSDAGAPPREHEGLSDETVIARVCNGETALFEELMRRCNQRVYRE